MTHDLVTVTVLVTGVLSCDSESPVTQPRRLGLSCPPPGHGHVTVTVAVAAAVPDRNFESAGGGPSHESRLSHWHEAGAAPAAGVRMAAH